MVKFSHHFPFSFPSPVLFLLSPFSFLPRDIGTLSLNHLEQEGDFEGVEEGFSVLGEAKSPHLERLYGL